jgi:uncharacterized protein (TIGR02099 family)
MRRRLRFARRSLVYAVAVALICVAMVVGALSQALPWIERHPEKVAAWLSERVGQPVSFENMQTRWTRRGPLLQLQGLQIGEAPGGISIGRAEILIAMYSGVLPGHSFTELRLRGPALTLFRDRQGVWSVQGLPMQQEGSGDPLDYLEGMGEVQIIDGRLNVNAPELDLGITIPRVDLRLRMGDGRLRAGARGWIGTDDAPLLLTLDFDRHSGDGRAYLDGKPEQLRRWSPLLHYAGVRPDGGAGRIQAWATLRQRRVAEMIVQVQLHDLSLAGASATGQATGTLAPGQLRMRVRWRAEDDGWRVDAPLLRLGDADREQNLDGLLLAGGTRFAASIDQFELGPMLELLSLGDILSPELRDWLQRAKPTAKVTGLSFAAERDGPLRLDAKISGLSVTAVDGWMGIAGLDGMLVADARGAMLALDPQAQMRFDWPQGFDSVHELRLDGQIVAWREDDSSWRVATPGLRIESPDLAMRVRGGLSMQKDGGRPRLDVAAELDDVQLTSAKKFWVRNYMPEHLMDWLDTALVGGVLTQGKILVSGDLDDWPFVHNDGRFEAVGQIRQGRIRFQEDWPILERTELELAFIGNGFQTQGEGNLAGVPVKDLKAGIIDFSTSGLDVAAASSSDAAAYLAMLKQSPLRAQYQETLDNLAVSGPAQVAFGMHLPLADDHGRERIFGKVLLQGAHLEEKRWEIAFDAVQGEVDYDQDGFAAPALASRYHDHSGILALRSGGHVHSPANTFEGDLSMSLDVNELFVRAPQLEWLAPYIYGRSDWTVEVALPKGQTAPSASMGELKLHSNLAGTALALPAPMTKPASATLPTTVRVGLPYDEGQIDVAFGSRLALRTRTRGDLTGVRVVLGSSRVDADPPQSGWVVNGRSDSIDALEWISLARSDGGNSDMPLRQIDVRTHELRLLGNVFPDARLRLQPQPGGLRTWVDGPALAGEVWMPNADGAAIEGQFSRAYWKSLSLSDADGQPDSGGAGAAGNANASTTDAVPQANVGPINPASIPPLSIDIDDLRLGEPALGKLSLRTQPVAAGMAIRRLDLRGDSYRAGITGEWLGSGVGGRTHLRARVEAQDFGGLMDRLNYAGLMRGGQGNAAVDVSWPGSPEAFRPEALQGNAVVDVRNGQLLEVEPGAGRFLGLLSVAQLPRRLMLDFRDFFSKGFGFNRIHGGAFFLDGAARTDGVMIEGPAADIKIQGSTNLHTQQFDQRVDVKPKSGNLLPVVGAVAGGPLGIVVGAAANAVLGKPLGGIGAKTYHITGSWNDPKVEVVSREQPHALEEQQALAQAAAEANANAQHPGPHNAADTESPSAETIPAREEDGAVHTTPLPDVD